MAFPSDCIKDETDRELDFWLFLARVALNKQLIEKCIFAGDKNYSVEDFSEWLSNCFRIKQDLLSYPYEVQRYATNLIYDLEIVMNRSKDLCEVYKDIFYLYKKRPYFDGLEDDDLYDCDYEDEESSSE